MTTILLVDDQTSRRESLAALFACADRRVIEAADSTAAAALASVERPAVIVVSADCQPEAIVRAVEAALGATSASPKWRADPSHAHPHHDNAPSGHVPAPRSVVIYSHAVEAANRQMTWVGNNVKSLLGYEVDECEAAGWWIDRLHPDDRAGVLASLPALWKDGRLACEYRFRAKGGSYRRLRDEVRLIRNMAGEPISCVGSWSDLTEPNQLANPRSESETQYRDVVEAAIQGMGILQEGRIRYVNPAWARMFGYGSPDELIGQPWEILVAPEALPNLRARTETCTRGESVDLHPGWQGVRKDGAHIWLESLAGPIAWNGQPAVLKFLVDITQRRRLEEQFRQAQKMEAIGRLAGGIAHDFNNLLTVILGYSEIAVGMIPASDPLANLIEQIQKAGDRAAVLTRQLLAFSRKQVLMPIATDLNVLLADMEKMLVRVIGEDIDLRVSPSSPLWKVKVDPGQIEQVLMNLAINARDAMPQGGKLTVETANLELNGAAAGGPQPREYVLLAVSDTGCGMDQATQARMFEPFFTTKGPDKGTGLGLATVYGIVQQSGGRIDVYSELGIGTSFKVYLPRDLDGDVAHPAPRALPAPGSGSETVLLVEDDNQVRALARLVLGSHGYTVLEAHDGDEALRVRAQHADTIQLLISDVVMPRLSGPQLAERVKSLRPAIRVLFLSGYTDDAVVHRGVLNPGAAFLQKPFAPEALARKVRETLDGAE